MVEQVLSEGSLGFTLSTTLLPFLPSGCRLKALASVYISRIRTPTSQSGCED